MRIPSRTRARHAAVSATATRGIRPSGRSVRLRASQSRRRPAPETGASLPAAPVPPWLDDKDVTQRDLVELGLAGVLVAVAAAAPYARARPVLSFVVAAPATPVLPPP